MVISFVIGFFACTTVAGTTEEEDVMVLNSKNFDNAITTNKFIMVHFYAPWIENRKHFAPEYSQAATKLKMEKSDIKLAKIDATTSPDIVAKYQTGRYPALKLFRSGEPVPYNGQRTKESILNWLKLKSNPPVTILDSIYKTEIFLNTDDIVIIGFFAGSSNSGARHFVKAAEHLYHYGYLFGIVDDPNVFTSFHIKDDTIILFKSFEERRNDYKAKEFNWEDIVQFITSCSLPSLIKFEPKLEPRIVNSRKGSLYLVCSSKSNEFASIKSLAEKFAIEYKERIHVVIVAGDDEKNQMFLRLLGVNEEIFPVMRFGKMSLSIKYMPETSEINEINMKTFVEKSLAGKAKRIRWKFSEDIPKDWNKSPVKVLVGKNFEDVISQMKYSFVMFYVPWCGDCQKISPIWDQLADKFKDRRDIMIAKMDAAVNEVDSMAYDRVARFPSFFLYKKSSSNRITFIEPQSLERFLKFLGVHGVKWIDRAPVHEEL